MWKEILKFIAPPAEDASPRRVFYWRLTVSGFMVFLILFVVFSFGGIWRLDGFAMASDVDVKIAEAIQPINAKLVDIEITQTTQSSYLEQLVKTDFAVRIDREVRARCAATTREEKERIKSAIDTYQTGYKAVAGEKYDEPDCKNL